MLPLLGNLTKMFFIGVLAAVLVTGAMFVTITWCANIFKVTDPPPFFLLSIPLVATIAALYAIVFICSRGNKPLPSWLEPFRLR